MVITPRSTICNFARARWRDFAAGVKNRSLNAWLEQRWYGARPIALFIPLSALFVAITVLRRWAYRCRALRTVRLTVPVVVVGNISVGGTGKTPFAIWLAGALRARGYHPGIVTRGYGGRSEDWPVVVTVESDPVLVGDEAVLLARRTGLPVVAGPDRVAAAKRLLRDGTVNVIVSDDGLQHYRLARDMEIILFDAERGLGNGWRLPAGPLRESARRLARADLAVAKIGKTPPVPLPVRALKMSLRVQEVVSMDGSRTVALDSFAGQQVYAVAGIGHPQQFFALLTAHGLRVKGRALPDHAQVSVTDLDFQDTRPVFMTEKDAIKCRGFKLTNHWCVCVAASFTGKDAALILERVSQRLQDVNIAAERAPSGWLREKNCGRQVA